jgi:cell division protein FtsB
LEAATRIAELQSEVDRLRLSIKYYEQGEQTINRMVEEQATSKVDVIKINDIPTHFQSRVKQW